MVEKLSEQIAVVGVIDPDQYTTGTFSSGWIDFKLWNRLLAVLLTGDMASSATLNGNFQEAKTSTGGSAQTLTSGTFNLTALSDTDDNKQVLVNIRQDALTDQFTHVRFNLVVADGLSDAGVVILGEGKRLPASNNDLSTVTEIVN